MTHSNCRAIDVHTHVVPENFPAYPGVDVTAPWPSMVAAHACHRSVMISGSVFRTVPQQSWDTGSRCIHMDELGIGRQVLSPMPELLSYWLSPKDGAAMARHLNEDIARMVATRPERFFGLGAVPLQDVGLAIAELDHAVHTLGLAGVEIGTNVNGMPIGASEFEPFFAAAEAWGAAIFVHPLRPCGIDRLIGPAALEQVLAFPCETGLAAASLITGGTLERHPRLRIALSHGGGSFAALAARLQHAWSILPALRDTMAAPIESAKSFYYDSLVYNPTLLATQLALFGPTQTMIGSDYPFVIKEADPVARINDLGLDADTTALLTHENALRWLGRRGNDSNCQF
jgi:aminocarboxymuconate-semialdehyde decarboxylase